MWGAIASAAIGAAGNYLGSKGGNKQSWSPYGPAKQSLNNYINQLEATPIAQAWQGPVFADMNPYLSNTLGNMNQNTSPIQ